MNKSLATKLAVLLLIIAAFAVIYVNFGEYLSLDAVKSQQEKFQAYYDEYPWQILLGYFFAYVLATAISIPGAAVLTLLAGFLFGFWAGLILISFASSIGATAAFLVARFLIGESLQKKYGDKLKTFNEGVEKEGAFYLFALRLIPLVPFFLINLLMALTRIPAFTFYWVSQCGMLAGTAAYVFAGTELSKINSLNEVLSPGLIAAFVIIGVLPVVLNKIVGAIRARRAPD